MKESQKSDEEAVSNKTNSPHVMNDPHIRFRP